MASARGLRAVVVGGTGAIGRCILGELVSSPAYTEVLSLGRRETTIPENYKVTDSDMQKLKQEIVDFDLEKFTVENWKSCFEGKDVLFLAVGLVFAEARRLPGNTEENFKRVDLHLVVRCAEIAKAAGVRHVSMMSVRRAKADSMFVFLRAKGEADDAVEALGFERTTIWKVTIVDKGRNSRFLEKVLRIFLRSVLVEDLGLAMRVEAEQWALGKAEFPSVSRYEDPDVWEFARQSREAENKKGIDRDVPAAAAETNETEENEEKQAEDEQMKTQATEQDCDQANEGSEPLGGATEGDKNDKQD
ncbi:uncharacterized protein LOC134192177 [Corticium candelabrum]|uniref:uncharacterized protein LOC134192177 n=1 Tax=Corticium candelabrum TaxID=121492 RepID=UPI002E268B8C|nr:uncharacterized protein LOC134192177 [Corticium candelabrum]